MEPDNDIYMGSNNEFQEWDADSIYQPKFQIYIYLMLMQLSSEEMKLIHPVWSSLHTTWELRKGNPYSRTDANLS